VYADLPVGFKIFFVIFLITKLKIQSTSRYGISKSAEDLGIGVCIP
jgi:hypothetical protein